MQGVHCLLGRFYTEQTIDYDLAFYHLEQSLVNDIGYIETYYYSQALINYGELEKAKKLLNHAETVKGVCQSCIHQRMALISERKEEKALAFDPEQTVVLFSNGDTKARKRLKKAILLSTSNGEISF